MINIIDKLNLIKSKSVCTVKDIVKRMRKQATDWENICKDIWDKWLCKVYKEVLKFNNNKKWTTWFKKMGQN